MDSQCRNCGCPVGPGQRLCTGCGALVGMGGPEAPVQASAGGAGYLPPASYESPQQATPVFGLPPATAGYAPPQANAGYAPVPGTAVYAPPPGTAVYAPQPGPPPQSDSRKTEKWGFWLLPVAVLIPMAAIASFVLGIILAANGKGRKGALVIVLAVAIFTIRMTVYVQCGGQAVC